jgi:hypothetical protein
MYKTDKQKDKKGFNKYLLNMLHRKLLLYNTYYQDGWSFIDLNENGNKDYFDEENGFIL